MSHARPPAIYAGTPYGRCWRCSRSSFPGPGPRPGYVREHRVKRLAHFAMAARFAWRRDEPDADLGLAGLSSLNLIRSEADHEPGDRPGGHSRKHERKRPASA